MFQKHTEAPLYAGLMDIGSGTISIAIAESSKEKPFPRIIYTANIPLRFKAEKETAPDLTVVTESIFSASKTLINDGERAFPRRKHDCRY